MKIIEGFFALAMLNIVFINLKTSIHIPFYVKDYFSDSPTYFEVISAEDTEKNVASASVAHALARYVFPVPGG